MEPNGGLGPKVVVYQSHSSVRSCDLQMARSWIMSIYDVCTFSNQGKKIS